MLGIMTKVIEHIVELKIQPILFVNLPADTTKIVEEFSCLTFIYNLLKKDRDLDVPIVLIDEKQLSKINTVESSESLLEKMQLRQANVVLDLLVGAQVPSTFYQVDFSNFERIFTNFTGICQLFSWDIYDNNPDISTLFKSKSEAKSFSCKDIPTRGFVCLQPGPNGLKTKVYQEIRKNYENSDVILSVLERREQGALIRGIFSNLPAPKLLTDKYSTLSRFNINLYNLEDQIIDFNTKEVLEKVIKANFFEISLIEDVQKLESDQ